MKRLAIIFTFATTFYMPVIMADDVDCMDLCLFGTPLDHPPNVLWSKEDFDFCFPRCNANPGFRRDNMPPPLESCLKSCLVATPENNLPGVTRLWDYKDWNSCFPRCVAKLRAGNTKTAEVREYWGAALIVDWGIHDGSARSSGYGIAWNYPTLKAAVVGAKEACLNEPDCRFSEANFRIVYALSTSAKVPQGDIGRYRYRDITGESMPVAIDMSNETGVKVYRKPCFTVMCYTEPGNWMDSSCVFAAGKTEGEVLSELAPYKQADHYGEFNTINSQEPIRCMGK